MRDLVMLSSVVPDFYGGFWSCGTGTVIDWLLDFSSEIRKTEAGFTSKQGVFHSSCKPVMESNLDHGTKAFGLLLTVKLKTQIVNVCG